MAFKTFAVGEVLTASDVNTYLMRQSLIVCTSTTRPSAPGEGWHILETDTDKIYVYSGSAWVEVLRYGGWTSFTPTWTNVTLGTGATNLGRYTVTGKTLHFQAKLTLGTGGDVTGFIGMSGPSGLIARTGFEQVGTVSAYSVGANQGFVGAFTSDSGTTKWVGGIRGHGSIRWTTTVPFDWTSSDILYLGGTIELD